MLIPDPDFYSSRIPDLGSNNSNKRGGGFCYPTFFVATNITKSEKYGSRIREKPIPDPEVKKTPASDPQHWRSFSSLFHLPISSSMQIELLLCVSNRYFIYLKPNQCCGSMTFWCGSGSGSADPCLWLLNPDPDPDPAIFVIDLQDANKKIFFIFIFSAYRYYFWRYIYITFKDKMSKESAK